MEWPGAPDARQRVGPRRRPALTAAEPRAHTHAAFCLRLAWRHACEARCSKKSESELCESRSSAHGCACNSLQGKAQQGVAPSDAARAKTLRPPRGTPHPHILNCSAAGKGTSCKRNSPQFQAWHHTHETSTTRSIHPLRDRARAAGPASWSKMAVLLVALEQAAQLVVHLNGAQLRATQGSVSVLHVPKDSSSCP